MVLEGYGLYQITRRLNQETNGLARVAHFNRSYVSKILHSRAVLGEFQPHQNVYVGGKKSRKAVGEVIANYYPRIIDDTTFYAAQQTLASKRSRTGGPSAKYVNLFQGLLYDADDGSRIQTTDKGFGKRYVSVAKIEGRKGYTATGAKVHFPVDAFEAAFFMRMS